MESNKPLVVWTAAGILLLQFVTIPFLGDIANAGKLYIFCLAVLAYALWFRFQNAEFRASSVVAVFILLWAVFFVSAWQALEPGWALLQSAILAVFLLFLLLVTHLAARVPAFLEKLVDALLFFGVLAALLGLYEHVHYLLLGPTRSMLIPYLLPPNTMARVYGPYGQPNQFALFLTVSLLAFFYRYIHRPTTQRAIRFTALRYVPFALVAWVFFLTLSRAGLLSLGLVFGFLVWLVASRRYLATDAAGRREFFCLLLLLGTTFFLSKMLAWSSASDLNMIRPLGDTGINPSGRYVFWTSAVLIFLDHPWLGIGLDHYKNVMNAYGPLSHEFLGFVPYEAMKSTNWAHNDLLQILCEGGIFAFALVLFLLILLLLKIWKNFVRRDRIKEPFFLYCHLFLLPFVIQSMFEWPLRSAPLLILFFACLGGLLSQYPLKKIRISLWGRRSIRLFLVIGLCLAASLFYQEIQIGTFKRDFLRGKPAETSLETFATLAERPYSSHRVLKGALPGYLREALNREDDALARKILPYYERLSTLEGARWQWYDLARLYLKIGRETDAREAIQRAIDLMPLDSLSNAFLHYLNMLKAARATGRPLDSFWPLGQKIDFTNLELVHD
jgi:O-antigen ligase